MDHRDYNKAFLDWLCSITSNCLVKSLTYDYMRAMYERDYVLVSNLCNGFGKIKTIDGAKERYKEIHKSVLEISPLSEKEKKELSAQIDLNAEEQKRSWVNILQAKGITITE